LDQDKQQKNIDERQQVDEMPIISKNPLEKRLIKKRINTQ
jgi:hypothetical protein